jgi:hypothetical protein
VSDVRKIDGSGSGYLLLSLYGLLYGFLYFSIRRRVAGLTVAGWLQFLALMAGLLAWLNDRSILWLGVSLILIALLRLLHWKARRDGYVRFAARAGQNPPKDDPPLEDDLKIAINATGRFAVMDEEVYVVNRPAHYWRAPIGDHALMVRRADGRFVYEFVQSGALESVRPGWLIHGRRPRQALAVDFLSSWGPGFVDDTAAYFVQSDHQKPARLRRSVYLTFENEATRRAVWRNLLRDVKETPEGR